MQASLLSNRIHRAFIPSASGVYNGNVGAFSWGKCFNPIYTAGIYYIAESLQ
jgi:hypothetical protein